MLAYTYLERGKFALLDKPKPVLLDPGTPSCGLHWPASAPATCTSSTAAVPRAVPGITVGHEMVGVVEEIGAGVTTVTPGDRVTVNVETFCGDCFFCRHGWVNNCTDPNGGWALGCRIDGGQAEYVRVPYADQGLTKIPHCRDGPSRPCSWATCLATGYWAAQISKITPEDTVLILGAGPTGTVHSAVRAAEESQTGHRM